jgi:hypothetical protein
VATVKCCMSEGGSSFVWKWGLPICVTFVAIHRLAVNRGACGTSMNLVTTRQLVCFGGYPEQTDVPWVYMSRGEAAVTIFDDAISWSKINPAKVQETFEAEDEGEREGGDNDM